MITQLYKALSRLSLLSSPTILPYSTPALRHGLRMRPFLPILTPAVPTLDAFREAASSTSAQYPAHGYPLGPTAGQQEALALLDAAEDGVLDAKVAWESVGKASPRAANIEACEEAWRAMIKDVVRSTIQCRLVIGMVRKWILAGGLSSKQTLVVEVWNSGTKAYHPWWIVPSVKSVPVAAAVGKG